MSAGRERDAELRFAQEYWGVPDDGVWDRDEVEEDTEEWEMEYEPNIPLTRIFVGRVAH